MLTLNIFTDFLTKNLDLVNTHKYANRLICIFEFCAKGQ